MSDTVDFTPLWKTPTRAQAVSILRACRAWTDRTIAGLTSEQLQTPTALGDGTWTIKDLLGHLAAWERRALGIMSATERTPGSSFATADEFNAHQLEVTRGQSLDEVRREYDDVRSRLVTAIEEMTDERWMEKLLLSSGSRSARALIVAKVLTGGKYGYLAHDFDHRRDLERSVAQLTSSPA